MDMNAYGTVAASATQFQNAITLSPQKYQATWSPARIAHDQIRSMMNRNGVRFSIRCRGAVTRTRLEVSNPSPLTSAGSSTGGVAGGRRACAPPAPRAGVDTSGSPLLRRGPAVSGMPSRLVGGRVHGARDHRCGHHGGAGSTVSCIITVMDLAPTPVDPEPTPSAMRRALRRAADGLTLDATEASVLLAARGEDLDTLGALAAARRDARLVDEGRPGVVTYSRKVFVPLTRLCRDRCHYCTFVTVPGKLRAAGEGMFLEPDEVVELCRRGAEAGCKEALFTLGDRPEERWPEARDWLESRGFDSTLDYVRAMSIRVLEETGLLPHLNPGVMSWSELSRLKPVAPSMGMMLETTATRL